MMNPPPEARTPDEWIAAVRRPDVTFDDRVDALRLLRDMLDAAAKHGVTYEDFAGVTALASACVDVVMAKRRDRGPSR